MLSNSAIAETTFQKAIKAKKHRYPYTALKLLDQVENVSPQRVNLEKASNYYMAAEYGEAKALYKSVIMDDGVPSSIRLKALDNFKKAVRKEKSAIARKHGWKGEVSVEYGQDDNANVVPLSDLITDLPNNQVRNLNISQEKDSYKTMRVKLAHRYRKPGSFDFFGQAVGLHWNSRLSFLDRNYSDLDTSDQRSISVDTGAEFRRSGYWSSRWEVSYRRLNLNGDHYLDYAGGKARQTVWYGRHHLGFYGALLERRYADVGNSQRNGLRGEAGIYASWELRPRLSMRLGIDRVNQKADLLRYAYKLTSPSVQLNYRWQEGSRFHIGYSLKQSRYRDNELNYDSPRADDIHTWSTGFYWAISKNSFSSIRYSYTDADANHQIHRYERHRWGISLGWKF